MANPQIEQKTYKSNWNVFKTRKGKSTCIFNIRYAGDAIKRILKQIWEKLLCKSR